MIADLSQYDRSITDLFASESNASEFELTREQIEFYKENGLVASHKKLSDGQIASKRDEM